ncbi:hypothetical protein HELRODRAFT_157575 [Helobdella robusta]|uniref:Enolase n=1 Tax=Helobdella robusta TaxID=6412 RepID=T1EMD3_HELRO|nr:hypothetical protein HELRODRAFT_157575 [Helobdella robusta]ESN97162.1 hypothetical protein HELRODRAFT_157575 [Helobdella robusta]
MPTIRLEARYIYDSRGIPTIEVELGTKLGVFSASTGGGSSIGKHEVLDVRDRDTSLWQGRGLLKTVSNINNIIAPALIDNEIIDIRRQEQCDLALLELDGSENKNKLGSNGLLPVSIAICKAGAGKKRVPVYRHIGDLLGNDAFTLPVPLFTVISGGKHAGNNLAYQEVMIMPTGARSFREAMRMGAETSQLLFNIAKSKLGLGTTFVGDSGGLAVDVDKVEDVIDLVGEAIKLSGYTKQVDIALDVSASSFYRKEYDKYDFKFKNPKPDPKMFMDRQMLLNNYIDIIGRYQIASITDPFYQDHLDDWTKLKKACPRIQLVGDDLTVTNYKRIKKVGPNGVCNCLCLKMNQIGTVTEAMRAFVQAKTYGWSVMISDRAGETDDVFIADLALGTAAGQLKAGGLCRSEHLAKYNYLLKVEETNARNTTYTGNNYRDFNESLLFDENLRISSVFQ